MSLMRWEPFRELLSLREAMNRLMEETFLRPWEPWTRWTEVPAVDMYETDEAVVVKAAVPGVKPEDVEISVTGDTLTIRGEVKREEKVKDENYVRQERFYGTFCRSLLLPTRVVAEDAEAVFENGILTLTLPKAEEVKPKTIKVKAKK